LDSVLFLVGEIFNQVVEESGELFNGFLRNTDGLGGEELSEDGSEFSTSLDLDHLDEGFVDVVGELNETFGTFSQFLEEREDTVDSINSWVELVIDDIDEVSVFSFSLDLEVGEDFTDVGNVFLSLGLVKLGSSEGVFQSVLGFSGVSKSVDGIVNFRSTETNILNTFW